LATINKRLVDYSLVLEAKALSWQDFSLYEFKIKP